MAFVKVRVPRTSQPQDVCGIDWSNPLAVGLIGLWMPSAGLNGVGGLGGTLIKSGTVDAMPGASGIGWKTPAVNSTAALAIPDFSSKITTEASAILVLSGGTTADQGFCKLGSANNLAADHYPYGGGIYSSAFTNTRWVGGLASKVDLTKPHVVGIQFKNGLQRFSQAGITLNTAANGVNPTTATPTLFESSAPTWGYSGKKHLVGIWNRYLSDAETKALADNPWQLLEPEEQLIWIPDSAESSGATSYSLTADSAAITLSSTAATLTVARTLSASTTAITVAAQSAALQTAYKIPATTAAITVAAQDATLTHATAGSTAYSLAADSVAITLAAQAAALRGSFVMPAASGDMSIAGQDAALQTSRRLAAESVAITLAGQAATLTHTTAGVLYWPAPAQVQYGVVFGPASEYTGTLTGGTGPSAADIAAAVVSHVQTLTVGKFLALKD